MAVDGLLPAGPAWAALLQHHAAAAMQQRSPDLECRGIEGGRRHMQPVCCGSMRAKSCACTSRTIARCGTSTPLGLPVEPDVNIT